MSYAAVLIESLKRELKVRGITYGDIAKGLDVAEGSVKRMFAQNNFTLQRVDEIMKLANIEVSDLATYMHDESRLISQLTYEQEQEIVSETKMFLVTVCLLSLWPVDHIMKIYKIEQPELIKLLMRLDNIGFIDLLPNNRVKLLVSRTFRWIPNGPLQHYLKKLAAHDYLNSEFSKEFEELIMINLMLSKTSAAIAISKLKQLAREFSAMHQEDGRLPMREKVSLSLLLAARPWIPEILAELLHRPF